MISLIIAYILIFINVLLIFIIYYKIRQIKEKVDSFTYNIEYLLSKIDNRIDFSNTTLNSVIKGLGNIYSMIEKKNKNND